MAEDKAVTGNIDTFVLPEKEAISEHYELMLLVSGNATEESAAKTFAEVKELLGAAPATITSEDPIGRQNLSYEIEGSRAGSYYVVEFDMERQNLAVFQEKLRIRKDVARYLIIKKRIETEEQKAAKKAFQEKREQYRAKKMIENATAGTEGDASVEKAAPAKKAVKTEAAVDTQIDKLLDDNVTV